MGHDNVDIITLVLNALDNKVDAKIYARNTKPETSAAKGKIKASGSDLSVLIKVASQFIGDGKQGIKLLPKRLTGAPESFDPECCLCG